MSCRLLLILCWSTFAARAADPGPGHLRPDEPRAAIRGQLLSWTKLGSGSDEVLKRIREGFKARQPAVAPKLENHPATGPTADRSPKKGARSIRLVLGHYQADPALLLLQNPMISTTTTIVQWAFDADGKLIEVFVDKDRRLGSDER